MPWSRCSTRDEKPKGSPRARFSSCRTLIAWGLLWAFSTSPASAANLLVLMHDSGRVERYDVETGSHVGTVLSGLPPANDIKFDNKGRLLISTGLPGGVGKVLRFDPSDGGKMETLLDIAEGYGGRLFRATGMAWIDGDLLVASQGDGKVKRYDSENGEWKADVALASPGAITQIAVTNGRLYLTDHAARAVRRAVKELDGKMTEVWASYRGQAPWGLVLDDQGRAYFSTAGNRIARFDGERSVEWAGEGGGLATPIHLALGPDGKLYAANLHGKVTVWSTEASSTGPPLRVLGGLEMRQPISLAFTSASFGKEFVYNAGTASTGESEAKVAFFESRIRPLLHARCIECHGIEKQKGGLRLDSRAAWQEGGDSGSPIIPGKPEESLLIEAVRYADADLQMPPKQPLSREDVQSLEEWIRQGAVDPRSSASIGEQPTSTDWAAEFQRRLDWWSLRPLGNPKPPKVVDASWSREPIDCFIHAALSANGLSPASAAEPEVILRRLSFVLTGLPPSPARRQSFLDAWQHDADLAYIELVDSLLASPHLGERFARHWMDAVRYTDTYGYEWDNPAKGSHEYRDYLIRAFNRDVGFDTMVREQLAGDLLASPRLDEALGVNESLIGPMFYHMGEHRHGSSIAFNGIHQEMVNNKIDAFSKVFLATTVACARCHDHKLEAVSQRDYYALGAVFMTPRWVSRPVDAPGKNAAAIARLKELRQAIRLELAARWATVSIRPKDWRAVVEAKGTPQPKPEDVAYPLARLIKSEGKVGSTWTELAAEWKQLRGERLKLNAGFQVLADFTRPGMPAGWVVEGDGMVHGWVEDGTPLIALDGDQVVARLLPQGVHTHALSSKLPGVLRMPPQHLVSGAYASLRLAGGEYAGYLIKHANAFQGEEVTFLKDDQTSWKTFKDTELINGVTQVTVDFATASLNPNFPPRTGLAPGLPPGDLGHDKRSWLSLTGIVSHESAEVPRDTLDPFASLYTGEPPPTVEAAEQRVSAWFSAAVQHWREGKSQPGETPILEWLLSKKLLPNQAEPGSLLASLLAEYRRVEDSIAFPRAVNGMDERESARQGLHFNPRGNVDSLGELVQPDFLQMFAGRNEVAKSPGSGRLELAESLLDPEHPLTSRVYVNRVWQWIFGEGLVATPDDFGRLGERPSNPELLDWLARDFMRQGWSTKRLVRRIVLSQTFRQSGAVSSMARERDPGNRLRHHYSTRRLEAEAIRDAMLAVSGRLEPRLHGRPINPLRAVEDPAKRLFSGPLDGSGRRSLYLTMSIMSPPSFLKAFDLPDLKLPSGRRNVTSVPTQALLLMNDPLVVFLARHWAEELVRTPSATPEERIGRMILTAYGRAPREAEIARWKSLLDRFRGESDPMTDLDAWAHLAHVIFNTKEFLYYQ